MSGIQQTNVVWYTTQRFESHNLFGTRLMLKQLERSRIQQCPWPSCSVASCQPYAFINEHMSIWDIPLWATTWSQGIRVVSIYWSGSKRERIHAGRRKLVSFMPKRQAVLFTKIRMKSDVHMWSQIEEQLSIYRFRHWCSERVSIQFKWHVFNSHGTCYE